MVGYACETLEDGQLISRAVAGEGLAFALLFERHAPAVRCRVAGRTPGRWAHFISIEDVMQETALAALLAINGFRGQRGESFRAWLTAIAIATARGVFRRLAAAKRGGRRRFLFIDQPLDECRYADLCAGTDATPGSEVVQREARAAVIVAINQLPESQSQVIRLCDLRELSVREAAAALGCGIGAIHMRRARAYRQLQRLLDPR